MGKISVGMLGWRFDEDDVVGEDGTLLSLEEMPRDARERMIRLDTIYRAPCHACWLIHGDANIDDCNTAHYVYGEPMDEVLLCEDHEPDFVYWFREAGGARYRGEEGFEDAFHEWFLEGGRAPEGYEGMEYVETDPDDLPEPPEPDPDEHGDLMGEEGPDLDAEYPRG